ncbi:MAG: CDP-alcohol phosphatidyltransferase family protein [Bacteroidales bacterium]|jgi:CDP-diacylglycerol--serine O-phosphatidyltransferase|nr:CDP-alcohol phosphatidyltransferase family protein [Bacteroidales bacterium]
MKKHIPNILTCGNLITGCVSLQLAALGHLEVAASLIFVAAFFDFLDGFAARLLKVKSLIGVDMDSLADVVSFGCAPAMILFSWIKHSLHNLPPDILNITGVSWLPYVAFIVPAFSAFRLARYNHDEQQTFEFRGLPTPANAFFLGFLPFAAEFLPFLSNPWVLTGIVLCFSILLVTDIPMFALKFKHFRFQDNELRYIFLFISLMLILVFRLGAFPIVILTYILISLITLLIHKMKS